MAVSNLDRDLAKKPDQIPKALADLMKPEGVTVDEIQKAVARKGYYAVDTPINTYDPAFIAGVLIGSWPQVLGMIKDIRESEKVYCPDCGTELQAIINTQMIAPYHSHLYFYCTGQCHIEGCTARGWDPATISSGTPKFYVQLSEVRETREQIDSKANAAIALLTEKGLN